MYVKQERKELHAIKIVVKAIAVVKIVNYLIIEHCEETSTGRQCVCNSGLGGANCDEKICTDPSMCGSHGIFGIK